MLHKEDLDAAVAKRRKLQGLISRRQDELLCFSICHPEAGLSLVYVGDNGTLHLECKQCDRLLAEIAVANRPPP